MANSPSGGVNGQSGPGSARRLSALAVQGSESLMPIQPASGRGAIDVNAT